MFSHDLEPQSVCKVISLHKIEFEKVTRNLLIVVKVKL